MEIRERQEQFELQRQRNATITKAQPICLRYFSCQISCFSRFNYFNKFYFSDFRRWKDENDRSSWNYRSKGMLQLLKLNQSVILRPLKLCPQICRWQRPKLLILEQGCDTRALRKKATLDIYFSFLPFLLQSFAIRYTIFDNVFLI